MIINDNAIKILQDLELLNLLKIRTNTVKENNLTQYFISLKGTMRKQLTELLDQDLNQLRNEWE